MSFVLCDKCHLIDSGINSHHFTNTSMPLLSNSLLCHRLDYIKALSNNVISNNQKEAKGALSDAHNHILLIGSASVVTSLRKFSRFIAIDNYNSEHFTIDEHDRLLTFFSFYRNFFVDNFLFLNLKGTNSFFELVTFLLGYSISRQPPTRMLC